MASMTDRMAPVATHGDDLFENCVMEDDIWCGCDSADETTAPSTDRLGMSVWSYSQSESGFSEDTFGSSPLGSLQQFATKFSPFLSAPPSPPRGSAGGLGSVRFGSEPVLPQEVPYSSATSANAGEGSGRPFIFGQQHVTLQQLLSWEMGQPAGVPPGLTRPKQVIPDMASQTQVNQARPEREAWSTLIHPAPVAPASTATRPAPKVRTETIPPSTKIESSQAAKGTDSTANGVGAGGQQTGKGKKNKTREIPKPGKRTFIHLDPVGDDATCTPPLQRIADVAPQVSCRFRQY